MDKREFTSEDALSAFQEPANPGRYEGVVLYFEGTNATGTTSTIEDLGNVTIDRGGSTKIDRPVHLFADIMNIRKGSSLFSSASGGAFEAYVFVPFYEQSFHQAWQITGGSELVISYNPDTGTPANFASLNVSVYGSLAFANEEYDYFILGNDQTPGGAWTNHPVTIARKNITNVFLRDPGSILTDAGLRQNGETRFTLQPEGSLEGATLFDNRLEANSIDLINMKTFTPNQEGSVFNEDTVVLLSTSGGGNTVELTYTAVVPYN